MRKHGMSLLVLAVFGGLAVGSTESEAGDGAGSTARSAPTEVVYNSAWDGSVSQVERYLKNEVLKDPDSYQSIEWSKVIKTEAGFAVRHKFRAKNSFGGYVVDNYVFTLDAQGNVIGAASLE